MTRRPTRNSGSFQAVALAGLGFAVAARCLPASEPAAPAPRAAAPAPTPRPVPRADVAARPQGRTAVAARPSDPALLRRSELADWMRFRNDHPELALATEMAVRWRINTPTALREVAQTCALAARSTTMPELVLSGELVIRGRAATVRAWGCEPDPAPGADRFCDCLLEHVPEELEVAVPDEVADDALAPYEGLLSLRLWRL